MTRKRASKLAAELTKRVPGGDFAIVGAGSGSEPDKWMVIRLRGKRGMNAAIGRLHRAQQRKRRRMEK